MSTKNDDQIGYLELIRGNRNLRRIWFADIASLLGDWFNTIALYALVEQLTGSPLALSGVFATKMLSFALASPIAGLLADRLNRRRLMITCDLLRAVLVLGFLVIDEASEVPLLYALIAAQLAVGAAFMPARNAALPNVVKPRELVTANALMAATWSTLLAVGAAVGGLAAAWLGMKAVFVIDSATYVVSAFFVYRAVIPQTTEKASGSLVRQAVTGILSGWRYVLARPAVGRIVLVKSAWSLAGSALVYMLALLGKHLVPGAASVGIGYLFAARGLGTGIGPIAARAWVPKRRTWPLMFGLGICFTGVLYIGVGWMAWTFWLLPLVALAHSSSGANWAFSTVLLQERSEDAYRGRVFSVDLLLLTLVDAGAILIAGLLLEKEILSLRAGFQVFAGVQILCGILWLVFAMPSERAWQQRQEEQPEETQPEETQPQETQPEETQPQELTKASR